jgi:hypothetical protein
MKVIQCACCGADVTMPQFYNGLAYGYTCIKKVAPKQKQTKIVYVQADSFEVYQANFKMLKFTLEDKKYVTRTLMRPDQNLFIGAVVTSDGKCLVNLKHFEK